MHGADNDDWIAVSPECDDDLACVRGIRNALRFVAILCALIFAAWRWL